MSATAFQRMRRARRCGQTIRRAESSEERNAQTRESRDRLPVGECLKEGGEIRGRKRKTTAQRVGRDGS